MSRAAVGRERNPRGEGARLREDLVAAASEMVAETGDVSQLSLRGVARAIGIAAPSIYRHFSDLDQLKLAVVERAFARFAEARNSASEEIDDPARALLAGCRAYCRFALANPGPYRFMFSQESPARGKQSPTGATVFDGLVASIHRCQEAKASTMPDDPRAIAAQVWATLHGLILLRLNAPDFDWPESLEAMASHAVARLVGLDSLASDEAIPHPTRTESQ